MKTKRSLSVKMNFMILAVLLSKTIKHYISMESTRDYLSFYHNIIHVMSTDFEMNININNFFKTFIKIIFNNIIK